MAGRDIPILGAFCKLPAPIPIVTMKHLHLFIVFVSSILPICGQTADPHGEIVKLWSTPTLSGILSYYGVSSSAAHPKKEIAEISRNAVTGQITRTLSRMEYEIEPGISFWTRSPSQHGKGGSEVAFMCVIDLRSAFSDSSSKRLLQSDQFTRFLAVHGVALGRGRQVDVRLRCEGTKTLAGIESKIYSSPGLGYVTVEYDRNHVSRIEIRAL